MKIKITTKLIKWLETNHAGQHCLKYWVLSRIIASTRKNRVEAIEISKEEANVIPDRFLKAV